MATRTTHSVFRIREFHMPDGLVKEVFGDGPAPEGGDLRSDQMIEQTTKRTPFAEFVPEVSSPA